ncbi:unnamed protein product [Prorocentrum cordatum]|uniref:GPS domain-containing protein n=1 Tax=Prorocentrum cordatum TaxID=2364126 RepID=A0ABN9W004_9DINO|nr:unnamed protein product [Polarella glacialis]
MLGNFSVITWQISSTALSSTCFCDASSQIIFSMSAGLGSVSCACGHLATAASQTASTSVLQSGLNLMLGNFSVITWQISSTALSSTCFCDATSQMSFSMSAGLGSVSCACGHLATAASQTASTSLLDVRRARQRQLRLRALGHRRVPDGLDVVLQSGLNLMLGNFSVITWQISSTALSSTATRARR